MNRILPLAIIFILFKAHAAELFNVGSIKYSGDPLEPPCVACLEEKLNDGLSQCGLSCKDAIALGQIARKINHVLRSYDGKEANKKNKEEINFKTQKIIQESLSELDNFQSKIGIQKALLAFMERNKADLYRKEYTQRKMRSSFQMTQENKKHFIHT